FIYIQDTGEYGHSMASRSLSLLRLVLCAAVLGVAVWTPAAGQSEASRLVIATDVVCRDQPGVAAAAVALLRLGDQLRIAEEREEAGERWYFVFDKAPTARALDPAVLRGRCWVYGPLTTEF